jgi:cell division protein FtsL
MRLQATTYQTHLDINEFRRQIEQLKKDNEDIKLAIAAGKER